jgi:aspartate aminotransferase-like enzyme
MMNRRRFIGAVAGALSAGMRPGEAQQGEKVFRIGFLSLNSAESARDALAAFRQVLQERGWVEDKNLPPAWRCSPIRAMDRTQLLQGT